MTMVSTEWSLAATVGAGVSLMPALPGVDLTLERLADQLGRCLEPNEQAFLELGEALMAARGKLGVAADGFGALSARVDAGDGMDVVATLEASRDDVVTVTGQTRAVRAALDDLAAMRPAVGRPLATVAKIIGEIAALATNAKIQAAQIHADEVDFSVFTRDMDRLREMAAQAVRRAEARLVDLDAATARVAGDADAFGQDQAGELRVITAGLRDRLVELGRRRDLAHRALDGLRDRAAAIARRVERCVAALQINDLTSQRVAHVRTALDLTRALVGGVPALGPGLEWMAELTPERRRGLTAVVCRLQAAQLDRAAADFRAALVEVRRDLAGLRDEATAIRQECRKVFGGDGHAGGDSYIRGVAAEVARAAELLRAYCAIDGQVRAGVDTVAAGFAAMAEDVKAIQSIDADMRVMGLNATLKCTRLGRSGAALAVVAQELRACSRRTEETARSITQAIAAAATKARATAVASEREYQVAARLSDQLGTAAGHMVAFGDGLAVSLVEIERACGEVETVLAAATGPEGWDRRFDAATRDVAAELARVAESAGGGDEANSRDDVARLLGGHYTMASERVIHDLFDPAASSRGRPSAADMVDGPSDDPAIDDLFF